MSKKLEIDIKGLKKVINDCLIRNDVKSDDENVVVALDYQEWTSGPKLVVCVSGRDAVHFKNEAYKHIIEEPWEIDVIERSDCGVPGGTYLVDFEFLRESFLSKIDDCDAEINIRVRENELRFSTNIDGVKLEVCVPASKRGVLNNMTEEGTIVVGLESICEVLDRVVQDNDDTTEKGEICFLIQDKRNDALSIGVFEKNERSWKRSIKSVYEIKGYGYSGCTRVFVIRLKDILNIISPHHIGFGSTIGLVKIDFSDKGVDKIAIFEAPGLGFYPEDVCWTKDIDPEASRERDLGYILANVLVDDED